MMTWKKQLSKTPVLIFFIILGGIGVSTAFALVTITLAGNVIVTDDLTVDTDTLAVKSASNKVGVGTLTPEATLHVVGDCIGCMAFYEVSAESPIAGLNDLSCNPGDRVISGGGWVPGTTSWIRESWAFDFDTWRLSYTDVNGDAVAPGAFKIICAELEGDNTPPLAPILLTPADNAVICRGDSDTINFKWTVPSDNSGIDFFTLEVLDGEAQVVYLEFVDYVGDEDEDEDINVFTLPILQVDDEYFWNVKAIDGSGNEGPFAPVSNSFTIVTVC